MLGGEACQFALAAFETRAQVLARRQKRVALLRQHADLVLEETDAAAARRDLAVELDLPGEKLAVFKDGTTGLGALARHRLLRGAMPHRFPAEIEGRLGACASISARISRTEAGMLASNSRRARRWALLHRIGAKTRARKLATRAPSAKTSAVAIMKRSTSCLADAVGRHRPERRPDDGRVGLSYVNPTRPA